MEASEKLMQGLVVPQKLSTAKKLPKVVKAPSLQAMTYTRMNFFEAFIIKPLKLEARKGIP